MSQIYLAGAIQLLTIFLPMIGVQLPSDQLTSFAQTLILIITSIWILIRRHQQGDINVLGARK